jgi:hypothetical protein
MWLSPVLASYTAAWPHVDLTLRTGTTCELVATGKISEGNVSDISPSMLIRHSFNYELMRSTVHVRATHGAGAGSGRHQVAR